MSASFKDYFSSAPEAYARFRPHYPDALFSWLAESAPARHRAWDCATGNGQAATGLAPYFDEVIATDASSAQIAHAAEHPHVRYAVAPAGRSGLPSQSVELVSVAQALHWLDSSAFFAEAERVLVPAGILAIIGYGNPRLDDERLDATMRRYYEETVGPYWPPERRILLEEYASVELPYAELSAPRLTLRLRASLPELTGYLRTWSATKRYVERFGRDPVDSVEPELARDWGDPAAAREVEWPLFLRVGRK